MAVKRVAILGSTGSIGVNALDVIAALGGRYRVVALSAHSNLDLLTEQTKRFSPTIVCVDEERLEGDLRARIGKRARVVAGQDALFDIVRRKDVDIILFAIAGSACLGPLLEAIRAGKRLALANKEALVSAGEIVMKEAKRAHTMLVPIDSEHSAIFQCLEGRPVSQVSTMYLTSSGGPLLNVSAADFRHVTVDRVLDHPRWKMGRKITVDSATLLNKGLEVIEAHWLFGIDESLIKVVVHPEAIVHSYIELVDGSCIAQLGVTDMRLPIQYALTYPERAPGRTKRLDLVAIGSLSFAKPDLERFPCLALARQVLRDGGTYPAVLNAADEEAVKLFLDRKIPFYRIPEIIESVLAHHRPRTRKSLDLETVLEAERWARTEVLRLCSRP